MQSPTGGSFVNVSGLNNLEMSTLVKVRHHETEFGLWNEKDLGSNSC